jgi:hypothetical protein
MNSSQVRLDPESIRRKFAHRRQFYSRAASVIGADRAFRHNRSQSWQRVPAFVLVSVFMVGLLVGYGVGRIDPRGSQPALVVPRPTVVIGSPTPAPLPPRYRSWQQLQ